jgi:hypothetical protein
LFVLSLYMINVENILWESQDCEPTTYFIQIIFITFAPFLFIRGVESLFLYIYTSNGEGVHYTNINIDVSVFLHNINVDENTTSL